MTTLRSVLRAGIADVVVKVRADRLKPWQSLLPPIASAAATYGWAIAGLVIWNKGRPQPGRWRFDSPYSVQGEFL